MPNSIESSIRFKKPRAAVTGMMASVALLVGCGDSGHKKESIPQPAPTATSAKPPAATTEARATPYDFVEYGTDPVRAAKINRAVHSFGMTVLRESKTPGSAWGPFDTYCFADNDDSDRQGWTSQGFKPRRGDHCVVQHNPQYGGPNNQVSAEVVMGGNGRYTSSIVSANINTGECYTDVEFESIFHLWDATDSLHGKSTSSANSEPQAKAIDHKAIHCLNHTRP